jgi:hypothetical protein
MDKTVKRRHRYVYLPWTKREREDIDTLTNGVMKSWIQIRVKNDNKLMNIHATFTFK